MTTEPPRAARRSSSSIHLYLATLLAGAYVFAWWAFDSGSAPSVRAPNSIERQPALAPRSQTVVWYGELTESNRPEVHLPPGWEIATAAPSSTPPAAKTIAAETRHVPVRVAPRRSGRVRTRSS